MNFKGAYSKAKSLNKTNWLWIGGALLILILFGKRIINFILGRGMNAEERARQKFIRGMYVGQNTTITQNEAKIRADKMYNAMNRWGTDEITIVKQMIKKEYQQYVKFSYSATGGTAHLGNTIVDSVIAPIVGSATGNEVRTTYLWKEVYEAHRHTVGLTRDDLTMIAKAFDVRQRSNGILDVEYLSLDQWIENDDDGQLNDLFYEVFKVTPLI